MLSCAGYELRVFKCHSWKILLQHIIIYYNVFRVTIYTLKFLETFNPIYENKSQTNVSYIEVLIRV